MTRLLVLAPIKGDRSTRVRGASAPWPLIAYLVISCRSTEPPHTSTPPVSPAPQPADAALAPPDAAEAVGWLRGTTHVHAKPSGDSTEPVEGVVAWYEARGYDFIALTDHNQVTIAPETKSLIVIPGVELTHNRKGCEPPGDDSGNCRIHINALGVTARPEGKLGWNLEQKSKVRVELYAAAYAKAKELGAAVIQINHPNYYWGMTPDVLVEIAKGAQLVEIANVQFEKWNAGDANHLSVEAQWDEALKRGATLWGVASDDAHDYRADGGGKYPAGGAWVMVHARREPQAILQALAAGRFYSSTGVSLSRAERVGDELVVEVAAGTTQQHTIAFIENGKPIASVNGLNAKHPIPQTGYVRAVVTRDDGKKAWVQPVRR